MRTRRPGNGAAGTTKTNERGEERWGTMPVLLRWGPV